MEAEQCITVHALLEVVWHKLNEIDQWPSWQRTVSKASLKNLLALQAEFHWTSGGIKIHSQVMESSAPTAIRWSGRTLGTKADHTWSLNRTVDGTHVTTLETMHGWLVSVMRVINKNFFDSSLLEALADLKTEAERRHAV